MHCGDETTPTTMHREKVLANRKSSRAVGQSESSGSFQTVDRKQLADRRRRFEARDNLRVLLKSFNHDRIDTESSSHHRI